MAKNKAYNEVYDIIGAVSGDNVFLTEQGRRILGVDEKPKGKKRKPKEVYNIIGAVSIQRRQK